MHKTNWSVAQTGTLYFFLREEINPIFKFRIAQLAVGALHSNVPKIFVHDNPPFV